jgi:hypothetical protein
MYHRGPAEDTVVGVRNHTDYRSGGEQDLANDGTTAVGGHSELCGS